MKIGNLPETEMSNDSDYTIISQDNVKLLKIKLKNLFRTLAGGRGLKFWIEDPDNGEYLKRYINETGEYEHNGYFEVPGDASMVVATRGILKAGSESTWNGYYMDEENGGYYILRRTSSAPVIGGVINYRIWNTNDSRLSDEIGATNSRLDFGLPCWVLLSNNKTDLVYQLIYKDISGTETVLETIQPLDDTVEVSGLEFYVSGVPTAATYEPLFIEYDISHSQYKFKRFEYSIDGTIGLYDILPYNNAAFYYTRNTGDYNGYTAQLDNYALATGAPEKDISQQQFNNTWPLRKAWVDKAVTDYTGKLGSLKVYSIEFKLGSFTYPSVPTGGDEHAPIKAEKTGVIYYDAYAYDFPLGNRISTDPDVYEYTPPGWLEKEYGEPTIHYNSSREQYIATYTIPGYPKVDPILQPKTALTEATRHTTLAYLGSVMDIDGIPYEDPPGAVTPGHNKDAIHFIEHDAGIVSLGHALTYVGCYPRAGKIAFAAGYLEESAGEPTPDLMQLQILNNGTIYGIDYYIKMGDEYVSVRDITPAGVGMILTGTSAPSNDEGHDGDIYLRRVGPHAYKYLKFEIFEHKGSDNYTQLSAIRFKSDSNTYFDMLNWATARSNKPNYNATQPTLCLVDENVYSVALWKHVPTAQDPIIVYIDLFNPMNVDSYKWFEIWTAGDAEARDPSRWKLSASNDKFDWVVLNDRSDSSYSMPSARNSIGYSTTIDDAVEGRDDTAINKRYYKYNGTWIPLL